VLALMGTRAVCLQRSKTNGLPNPSSKKLLRACQRQDILTA
jgi:hypothetical protein